ncbi:MAG: hypothetical protein JWO03_85 [Bacteroidetes bacterium]|nr:hypothetical protein [Bacteroidota bacterium]
MKYILSLIILISCYDIHAQAGMDKMKQYYFVMLSKGPHRDQDSITADKIQAAHMANIQRLAKDGKLIVAGPFMDDSNWRGIFIFDAKDQKEVESILQTDLAISSGRLNYEVHPWLTERGTCFK